MCNMYLRKNSILKKIFEVFFLKKWKKNIGGRVKSYSHCTYLNYLKQSPVYIQNRQLLSNSIISAYGKNPQSFCLSSAYRMAITINSVGFSTIIPLHDFRGSMKYRKLWTETNHWCNFSDMYLEISHREETISHMCLISLLSFSCLVMWRECQWESNIFDSIFSNLFDKSL